MCAGSVLDASDHEYLQATGERTKRIGLGSYGDGMDRVRPMYVYPNPLSAPGFSTEATLIAERHDLTNEYAQLTRLGRIDRTLARVEETLVFSYYGLASAERMPSSSDLVDPFQRVEKRVETTSTRGRFRLDLEDD